MFGRMKPVKEEPSSCNASQAIDLVSAVKELHGLNSQELGKLLRDSENFTINYGTEKQSSLKIDVEKLASSLPLHLIAVLISSDKDEALFRYLTCGIRLLHSLCDLAPRNAKLEQILLDDVKVSEQLLDLVFYILIVLGGYEQKNNNFSMAPLMHSALVACSLHLLTGCISSQWQDLVQVLLAHPKVDIFMEAAFGAVNVSIKFLNLKLSSQHTDFYTKSNLTSEQIVHSLCQQCEASLQFLQLLCQQKLFRERLLRNKELCGKGGVLFLAQAILKLNIVPHFVASARIVAAVSRLKAKILSILLNLCEAESISYLDEVASSPGSLDLAKSVALEIIELLKCALGKDPRCFAACSDGSYPMGLAQLNAMRLADILSDDSNFRSYITIHFTKVLTAIFSLPHGDFLSSWCSSVLPVKEEDGTIEYDSFATAGWVLDVVSSIELHNARSLEFSVPRNSMTQASYAHQRTSLFVKIIANLHCFIPTICEEQERNLFANKFMECLQMDPSNSLPGISFASDTLKAATISRNLCSLLSHAESLIPNFLNEEDVQLLRVFSKQFESLLTPMEEKKCEELKYWDKFAKLNISEHHQEVTGGCSPLPSIRQLPLSFSRRSGNLEEIKSENSAFQDVDQVDVNSEHVDQKDDAMTEDKGTSARSASGRFTAIDRDIHNVETSGSDTSETRGKNAVDPMGNSEFPKSSEPIEESGYGGTREDEKSEPLQYEETQRRKRKRTIMNDEQVALVEKALIDEPDMQRNAASLQSWADKLSSHGSDVTSSQLKNWLNNRKARLARTKDVRAAPEFNALPDKQGVQGLRSNNSAESPIGNASAQLNVRSDPQMKLNSSVVQISGTKAAEAIARGASEFVPCKQGDCVLLKYNNGEEVGMGKVFQASGQWFGRNLEELRAYVVDIKELKVRRAMKLPYPSMATGGSFEEAETKIGLMRVLWDSSKTFKLPPLRLS
ncbi:putative Homeobox domain-containing protein [Rosa chinensis]|uniref:Putative Homeobox domain-containing protein n=1 Tax=Rosa chinensis TaxID=74649 RepID=A0A2P6PWE5_ROSCH|nr:nodulin homeobox [Rosa chinensis]XP_024165922.1 nodulin homeobox [Rosa chinensis]PRQ26234.1 putative Homeobox domain-containing protein [Rosa chinensis]